MEQEEAHQEMEMGGYVGEYQPEGVYQHEDYPQEAQEAQEEGEIEGIEEGEEEQQNGIQLNIARAGVQVTINQN